MPSMNSVFRAHAAALVLFSCLFLARPGAVLANPNVPVNVDYVYGFGDPQPQRWMNQNLYVAVYLAALWGGIFLPTHALLRRIALPAGAWSAKPPPRSEEHTSELQSLRHI